MQPQWHGSVNASFAGCTNLLFSAYQAGFVEGWIDAVPSPREFLSALLRELSFQNWLLDLMSWSRKILDIRMVPES